MTPTNTAIAFEPPIAIGGRVFTRSRGRTTAYWRAPYALRREPVVMESHDFVPSPPIHPAS